MIKQHNIKLLLGLAVVLGLGALEVGARETYEACGLSCKKSAKDQLDKCEKQKKTCYNHQRKNCQNQYNQCYQTVKNRYDPCMLEKCVGLV